MDDNDKEDLNVNLKEESMHLDRSNKDRGLKPVDDPNNKPSDLADTTETKDFKFDQDDKK